MMFCRAAQESRSIERRLMKNNRWPPWCNILAPLANAGQLRQQNTSPTYQANDVHTSLLYAQQQGYQSSGSALTQRRDLQSHINARQAATDGNSAET
jgi:hypothetical protein